MTTCEACKESFDDDLVHFASLSGAYRMLCGVCALEAVRKEIGVPDYVFQGTVARDVYMRTKAVKEARKRGNG